MTDESGIDAALARARLLAQRGEDEAAKQAYLAALRLDAAHFAALNELAALALASGHRSAARAALSQAAAKHPANPVGRVNLANLLLEDGDHAAARAHYAAALAAAPDLPEAHQGLARLLSQLGDEAAAAPHWERGYRGHALVRKPYRGAGAGLPLLLLVAARGGNIPTASFLDDRSYAVTALYADYHAPHAALPAHRVAMNAIGDADLCGAALDRAEALLANSTAPVINPPAKIRLTSRAQNAARLSRVAGVVAPRMLTLPRAAIAEAQALGFPLLLRAPGFHTGQHFLRVEDRAGLASAAAALPGDTLLAIQYLDARGRDGMARKYRVMIIDGALYPLHLAIASDWKVHYFTAAMAGSAAHREEERRFLDDMGATLGPRAMAALCGIAAALDLDYAGVDFALGREGELLLFEANATMALIPPEPDPVWDYRRRAVSHALAAAKRMLERRAASS